MSRNNTQVLNSIRMLCRMQNVSEKILYERSKLILSIYRDVCWSAIGRAGEAVSYTHLDVYKRQSIHRMIVYF